LEQAAKGEPDEVLVLLGAIGRGGAASIGVKALNPKRYNGRPRAPDKPLSVGFRPGHTPQPLLLGRFFGTAPVVRTLVQRADADWVHGRGQDARTCRLLGATVVVIGCGSVGAPVACALAQAGVGRLILVDPEPLTWPNVGRHPLGATAVGRNKAEALAERLQADFPHLNVEHRACGLHQLIARNEDLLAAADMIAAATGNWVAESALNRWHVRQGRGRPIVYGWTEAHACAGHAVAIGQRGGLPAMSHRAHRRARTHGCGVAGWRRHRSGGARLRRALSALWARRARLRERDGRRSRAGLSSRSTGAIFQSRIRRVAAPHCVTWRAADRTLALRFWRS
jgi:hypothetical protein